MWGITAMRVKSVACFDLSDLNLIIVVQRSMRPPGPSSSGLFLAPLPEGGGVFRQSGERP
jgi:hypothetical protein